jgi:signal transduction histidine kinase
MNEAVQGQRDAARRQLSEAWRGQLALIRDHLDSTWEKRAAELDAHLKQPNVPAVFAAAVRGGLADSVVVLSRDGSVAYPSLPGAPQPDLLERDVVWSEARAFENTDPAAAVSAWEGIADSTKDPCLVARAAQAQVRSLMQGGNKAGALRAIRKYFNGPPATRCAADLQGRFIAADTQLLTMNLTRADARQFQAAAERLRSTLDDYEQNMPSAQRLFLMQELKAAGDFHLPTFEAERLAGQFLEADRARAGDPVLRASGLKDVWKLSSPGGRIIALYRTPTVMQAIAAALGQVRSGGLSFAAVPPGVAAEKAEQLLPAGGRLPGWQVALTVSGDQSFGEISRRRTASYLWAGCGAIAAMALLALVAGQLLRRQMRVAKLKADLVATVSHELKTPLSSMRLLVDALLEDEAPEPAKTREYLQMIAKENLRLSRLIDNFLTFSRMERNRHKFEFANTSAREVVDAVDQAVSERFREAGCRLSLEVEEEAPLLRADRDALVTVLLNLLDNAYKFTGDEKRIRLRASGDGNGHVIFAVEDNGIGIAPREQKKIFRRFYQVDRRLSRAAGGCGLGLSIVDFIVRAHGGEVTIESRPGSGSVFRVSLPSSAHAKGVAA